MKLFIGLDQFNLNNGRVKLSNKSWAVKKHTKKSFFKRKKYPQGIYLSLRELENSLHP